MPLLCLPAEGLPLYYKFHHHRPLFCPAAAGHGLSQDFESGIFEGLGVQMTPRHHAGGALQVPSSVSASVLLTAGPARHHQRGPLQPYPLLSGAERVALR